MQFASEVVAATRNTGAKLFMFIGSIVLIVGIALACLRFFELSSMAKTDGVVVACPEGREVRQFWPCVEFSVGDQKYMAYSTVHTEGIKRPGRGEVVPVYYRIEDPNINRLGLWLDCWFVPALVSGVGVTFVLLPGIVLLTSRQRLNDVDDTEAGEGNAESGITDEA